MKRITGRWHYWLPGLVISALAVYLALSQVNGDQLRQSLATARYGYLLPCAALLMLGLGVRAVRWRGLLGGAITLPDSFAIVGIAYLTNSLMPLRAGEVARVYLATRRIPPIPAFTAAGTIVLERLLDALMILLWLSLTVAAGAPIPGEIRGAALVGAPVILMAFLGLVLLAGQRAMATRLLAALNARLPTRFDLLVWGERFLDGLTPLTQPRKLLAALLWTALGWVCTAGAGWALMFAFYDRGDVWVASLFVSALAFAVALPAVPGNLGTFELAIVTVLTLTRSGEPAGQAVAFAIILHAIDLGVYMLAGLFGFFHLGLSPTSILRREKEE